MSKFERLLEAGSTELPDCRCNAEMNLMAVVSVPGDEHRNSHLSMPKTVVTSLD